MPTSKGIEGRERGKEGNERKGSGRKGMGKAVRVETGRKRALLYGREKMGREGIRGRRSEGRERAKPLSLSSLPRV